MSLLGYGYESATSSTKVLYKPCMIATRCSLALLYGSESTEIDTYGSITINTPGSTSVRSTHLCVDQITKRLSSNPSGQNMWPSASRLHYGQSSHAVRNPTMGFLKPVWASRAHEAGATWKSQAVSGSMNRICAAAPEWKFSESRAALSAYEMGTPAMYVRKYGSTTVFPYSTSVPPFVALSSLHVYN